MSLSSLIVVLCAVLCGPYASAQVVGDSWMIVTNPQDRSITWTPTKRQVLVARAAARDTLQKLTKYQIKPTVDWELGYARDILRKWQGYRLQVCGFTHDHRRIIYLNFVTPQSSADDEWKRNELLEVSDGDSLYWQAKYDPAKNKIVWWMPNGPG
jgi:hypothetical protein